MTQWVIDYYREISPLILPFLRGRKIGIRQIFDGQIIYRRHTPDKKHWIYISTKKELLFWVRWHGWSYFPHLDGKDDLWFAMDVDRRAVDFKGVQIASHFLAEILKELKIKFLVKFSGNNGFHFLWRYKKPLKIKGKKYTRPWQFEQKTIEFLQKILEERLQASKYRDHFYRFLKPSDPITFRSANDPKNDRSILIDEYILKKKATIRAPYSLHEKSQLVSVPIPEERILEFEPKKEADPKRVMKEKPKADLPYNDPEKIYALITSSPPSSRS